MILKWGVAAVLRRASGDRPCTTAITTFAPMERVGKITNPVDRKALVSALAPDGTVLVPPDFEQDRLVVGGEELKIVEPAGQVGSSDVVVFWRLTVRR